MNLLTFLLPLSASFLLFFDSGVFASSSLEIKQLSKTPATQNDYINLYSAVLRQSVEEIESLTTAHSFDLNVPFEFAKQDGPPLCLCLVRKRLPLSAAALLKAGADPDVLVPEKNDPLLSYFVSQEDPSVVKLLLDHNADPNVISPSHGDVPSHRVVVVRNSERRLAIVRLLVDAGADPLFDKCRHTTPLNFATFNEYSVEAAMLMLQGCKKDDPRLNKPNSYGKTPISQAILFYRLDLFLSLVKLGAHVDGDDLYNLLGKSVERPAAEDTANIATVKEIIQALSERKEFDGTALQEIVDRQDGMNETLLNLTVEEKRLEWAGFLLESLNANPKIRSVSGQTPLHRLLNNSPAEVFSSHHPSSGLEREILDLIMKQKPDLNARNALGYTPFFVAVAKRHFELARD